ncbi:hypothetical protein [Gracilinema caldarium]|uniref:hypothetical protein n=1 Tax=Gracilinema caldarium TaxID=215591 RepID=UPI0012EA745C|nr:hypothetical protein [Gracilinema caldarium]
MVLSILSAPSRSAEHLLNLHFRAPLGLGVKIAERSDSNFHAKGNVWLKQLLES